MNYTEMLFNRDERLVNLLNQAVSKNLELIEEINNREDEIERLHSIIKEVREYATQHMMELAKRKGINGEENGAIYVAVADLVEILDKDSDK